MIWHPPVVHPTIPALALAVALLVPAAVPASTAAAEPDFRASMSGYHNWPELVAEIQQAAVDYPDIVSVFSIGKSYQGRDIWMAKVSDNVATDEAEPEVLIDALHHAREHLSTEQALAVLRWLTRDYGSNETVTRLVDTRETFIIFALNPDGLRFDLTGSPFRAWRKNRQPNAGTTAVGTDLNRNYDYRFGCCGGSSGKPSSIIYRGPQPFSAPETAALRDFVQSRVVDGIQQIRTHVTLHTNGKLVLWPYGYTRTDIPKDMTTRDHATFVALARAMASRNGYRAQQSSDLYVSDGDEIDWLYGRHRIFSFTFELYPAETATVWGDHYPDDSKIAAATERNRSAILYLIDRAACPIGVLGDAYTRADCGPMFDDLEINRGWAANAAGTDTATAGAWVLSRPAATSADGPKQLGTVASGVRGLVTDAAAGASATDRDVDGGTTSIRSRPVVLPVDPAAFGSLTFRYYLAHDAASGPEDAFRVLVETEDGTQTEVFAEIGAAENDDAAWESGSASLASWAGQTIRLVLTATDDGPDSLVEAAVDDIRIRLP
jgi:carboxypeptidase T